MFEQFFQTTPIPVDHLTGTYSIHLVILSYLVATFASYVALDITQRLRDVGIGTFERYVWLSGGSFAMGIGIWSMHFIGMLAFIMPMPMLYDPGLTFASIVIAVIASAIAFAFLQFKNIKFSYLMLGGIILGLAISSMHYTGMAAMLGMHIHYLPGIFALSILIGVIASEVALYLATISARADIKHIFILKLSSALIMGAGICGMHYTGMAAAVFTPLHDMSKIVAGEDPESLSTMLAITTFLLLGTTVLASAFKQSLVAKSMALARQSGMAEVASNVLHNVGNVLNSANVSVTLMSEHLKNIDIEKLAQVNQLIDEHKHDLGAFISASPRGSKLPNYLVLLTKQWKKEHLMLSNELKQLEENIQHIKEIIFLQQSFGKRTDFSEAASINEILDDTLRLSGIDFSRHEICLKKEYEKLKPVHIDRLKLTQSILNLLLNAKEALSGLTEHKKILHLKTGLLPDDSFFIQVSDNGMGIKPSDKAQLFSYGFTTKETGHGFGLHASMIALNEMKGSLTVDSEGLNKGATFTIKLPYTIA
jgi:NO-binding membrane sensor protein with MHYT domain